MPNPGYGRGPLLPPLYYQQTFVGATPGPTGPTITYVVRPHHKSLPDRGPQPLLQETIPPNLVLLQPVGLPVGVQPGEPVFELARGTYRIDQTWTWVQTGMLGQDQLPVGEQVTDLVPRSAPKLPYYEWAWNQTPMLGRDRLPAGARSTDLAVQHLIPRPIDQTWVWRQVQMLGRDQLPVGEQSYDLTPKPAPRLPLYSWEWRQVGMLGQDTVPGQQSYALPPPPRQPIDQTWAWRQVGMLGQDVVPGEQVTDLTPKAPSKLPYYGWEWNQLRMLGLDQLPTGKQVSELSPHRFTPFRQEQTWTWRQVGMLGQDSMIVGDQVYDLPNRGPLRPSDLYTWIQSVNLALTVTPVQLPRNQYDWPLPRTTQQPAPSWTWRQVGMLGLDRLPPGDQVFDLPNRGLRLALYDWIQSTNLALNVRPQALPPNQYDWPVPRGPQQPDRSFISFTSTIPPPTPFVGASYRLLSSHYLYGVYYTPNTIVTEGKEIPIGWMPTLAVDPLNSQAVTAYYNAGPRDGSYADLNTYGTMYRRDYGDIPINSPVTHWKQIPGTGMWQLTGLGAGEPPVGGG